jgi:hypothetical protein
MILDHTTLTQKLADADIDVSKKMLVGDRDYIAIKRDFLEGEFSRDLKQWVNALFGGYKKEVRDCDDFARWVAAQAQLWNSETDGATHALAFGECWYERTDGESHAINIAIVEGGDVVFYEPQTQKIIELTDREKWSGISEIRF